MLCVTSEKKYPKCNAIAKSGAFAWIIKLCQQESIYPTMEAVIAELPTSRARCGCPVARATSAGGPAATTRPPSSPAPGPMSITQSLPATTRMSCSTTITVLPGVDQALELRHQPLDVGGVQAGGRLVEDVERVAALGALQLGRQLDALRLAAGQLGGRLAEAQVAQADLAQHARATRRTRGSSAKNSQAASTVMRQHVGDVLAAIA